MRGESTERGALSTPDVENTEYVNDSVMTLIEFEYSTFLVVRG
jgi:hypothetical protein